MKITVFGAGAVGGHLAARLQRGGADVSVIARGPHLAAMQQNGLLVHTVDGDLRSTPRAVASAAELPQQDAVIITTKTMGQQAAVAAIQPLLRPDTPVVFVGNGIPWWYFLRHGGPRDGEAVPEADPGDVLRRSLPVEQVIGATVYSACTIIAPGVIRSAHNDIKLVLGEPDGSISARAQAIADVVVAGGMAAPVVPDIRREVWAKLMGNITGGPLCILSRMSMADSYADPAVKAMAVTVAEEAMAIAAAYGCALPGHAVPRIERASRIHHKPSILQDMEAGRPMEIGTMFLAPLRLGREAGVAVPTLAAVVGLAVQAARAAGLYGDAA